MKPAIEKIPAIKMKPYKNASGYHCHKTSKKSLKGMVKDYREKLDDNETRSCVIRLDDMKYLIEYYSEHSN